VRFTWGGGFLAERGFHDFAGSGVVHLVGGAAALVGARVVGPRQGRFDPALAHEFVPHNVPSVLGGTLLLLVGWFGFNPGSTQAIATEDDARTAALSAMVTIIAGTTAAATALCVGLLRSHGRAIDLLAMANALLAGLVAICAGADVIDPAPAVAVGVIGALAYISCDKLVRVSHIDDIVEATAVHGASGAWGCIAVGFFHRRDGLCYTGSAVLLGEQLIGCVVLCALSAPLTLLTALLLRRARLLRVTGEQESHGLDREFGLMAYYTVSEAQRALGRCSHVAALLKEENLTAEGLLEALTELRGIISRPFTPQASSSAHPQRAALAIYFQLAFLPRRRAITSLRVRSRISSRTSYPTLSTRRCPTTI